MVYYALERSKWWDEISFLPHRCANGKRPRAKAYRDFITSLPLRCRRKRYSSMERSRSSSINPNQVFADFCRRLESEPGHVRSSLISPIGFCQMLKDEAAKAKGKKLLPGH